VTTGPYICGTLKEAYPSRFACQGIPSSGYSASITDNMLPKGTAENSIKAGIKTFEDVHAKCPKSVLLFEGYSQGAAVMHNVIEGLKPETRNQLTGGVLFGDTKYKQTSGSIKDLPADKLKIFCVSDDPVCVGTLGVTAGHLAYLRNGDLRKSFDWLVGKADAALTSSGKQGSVQVKDNQPPATESPNSKHIRTPWMRRSGAIHMSS
jgi:cutinase